MNKFISFLFLLATALVWMTVVAPAQDNPAVPEAAADRSSAPDLAAEVPEASGAPADLIVGTLLSEEAEEGTLEREARRVFETDIFGFSIAQLSLSFFLLLLALLGRNLLTKILLRRVKKLTEKTTTKIDDRLFEALERPVSAFLLVIGFYIALIILPLSPFTKGLIVSLFKGVTMVIGIWTLLRVTDAVAESVADASKGRNKGLYGFVPTIRNSTKIFIVVVGLLIVIDNLGYNVGGILATLGLGGAAVAFASQDTIKNAFGTLMIMLDRPFTVGDWIQVGDVVDGDVESIGLRSTKVRTWPKTVLSIPNGVLANEYINNYSRMPKRRVKQVVGVTYESTSEDMEALVADIRKLLAEDEGVQQDFVLVNFTDFGGSSLDILVYYFTKTTAWLEYMDVRQRINCKIMRAIENRGLSVAFPTRTLYMDGPLASRIAGTDYESRWDMQKREGRPQIARDEGNQGPMRRGGGADGEG